MSQEKTHYRKAFNSPYLSAEDITEPTVLTVIGVKYEADQTKRSKDNFNVVYFKEPKLPSGEPTKPMILNSGNNEIIRKFSGGAKYIDDWKYNYPVTLFVDPNVRFGRDIVEGLRIASERPKQREELLPGTKAWNRAIIRHTKDGNLEAILKHMDISDANQARLKKEANDLVRPKTDGAE